MRVLFLSEQFWPYVGGVQVWAARLLPALAERDWEIVVATSHCGLALPDRERYRGVEVVRFPFWETVLSRDASRIAGVRRQFSALKTTFAPDLLHVNLLGPAAYFHAATAHVSASPTLVTVHDVLRGHGTDAHSLFGQVLRAANWVTAFSAFVLDDVRRTVPEVGPRSSLIHQGLDPPSFAPAPLPMDPPRLLCVGRLVPDKGFDVAIAAFARVLRRFPQARLTLASDGAARPSLEQQARELGLGDAVEFLGWTEFDRMPALLNSATVVLVPSRIPEGFGLVALEAALMARPVVASGFGALPEVVADGETGMLVERNDPVALAAAIEALLSHPENATAMGMAARRRALARFGHGPHVEAFDALYRRLTAERPALAGSQAAIAP